jgi:hypothetical protein
MPSESLQFPRIYLTGNLVNKGKDVERAEILASFADSLSPHWYPPLPGVLLAAYEKVHGQSENESL